VITACTHRVNYSETDQMGVVYHARYLVWLDIARTEHIRAAGMSYREIEARGVRLAVSGLRVRYRQPARYDDLVRVRCWVRDAGSRLVTFGYVIEHDETEMLLATAETSLVSLDQSHHVSRMPDDILARLAPTPDPVRL
jgi:acyl-CoA thioester hydrolase